MTGVGLRSRSSVPRGSHTVLGRDVAPCPDPRWAAMVAEEPSARPADRRWPCCVPLQPGRPRGIDVLAIKAAAFQRAVVLRETSPGVVGPPRTRQLAHGRVSLQSACRGWGGRPPRGSLRESWGRGPLLPVLSNVGVLQRACPHAETPANLAGAWGSACAGGALLRAGAQKRPQGGTCDRRG